ncbi:MAG: CRISPR-associated endonuclease Cas2 [Propionibacteriaceae bacterium]|jgi:CRISPR-associated protein Cas2|nr:CRISPR-associated endonuclease Cas2 [Propionibacteriaceae bacterium]
MVMFDLPVKTKPQRKEATSFRLLLLDLGFVMVQLSVYTKFLPAGGGLALPVKAIRTNLPRGGMVRILTMTDHQWAQAIRFSNGEPETEDEEPDLLTLF